MVGLKLVVLLCAAFIFVWKVFHKKREEADASEDAIEELFNKQPHDIIFTNTSSMTSKYRTSYTQKQITIGRLDVNTIALASPLISGQHAVIKWNALENLWTVRDLGSTNGTRLNALFIGCENRQKSEEHPLRNGDVLTLAEEIQLEVELVTPGPHPITPHTFDSHLRISPRRGVLTDGHTFDLIRPLRVEYYCESIFSEFAFLTQVGIDHARSGCPSEDVVFWESPFGNFHKSAMFGICDGHLNSEASLKIATLFPKVLGNLISRDSVFQSPEDGGGSIDSLHSAFLELDSRLTTDSGSTATVLLTERMYDGDVKIQVANVGDSLGILINTQDGSVVDLTADHRVVNESERHRLEQLGAPLTNNGTRLCTLNLARALGDSNIKNLNIGLIAEPYISPVFHLTSNKDHLIVIASDGLWDFVHKKEVASLAVHEMQEWAGTKAFGDVLIKRTLQKRGSTDDISVFVARV